MSKIVNINQQDLKEMVAEGVRRILSERQEPISYYPTMWYYYPESRDLGGDMGYEFDDAENCKVATPEEAVDIIETYFTEYYADERENMDGDIPVYYVDIYGKNGVNAINNTFYISKLDADYVDNINMALARRYKHPVRLKII